MIGLAEKTELFWIRKIYMEMITLEKLYSVTNIFHHLLNFMAHFEKS